MFFFFACPKEKEPKRKGSRSLGPPAANYPALLELREMAKEKAWLPILITLLGLHFIPLLLGEFLTVKGRRWKVFMDHPKFFP